MFINCKKNMIIRVGGENISIPANFIGQIPDQLKDHWMIKAAIKDGTIAVPQGLSDMSLEKADQTADKKAKKFDKRLRDSTEDNTVEQ